MLPTVKSLHISNSYPPSTGFCIAIQTVSQYLPLPDKVSDVVHMGKFMKKY